MERTGCKQLLKVKEVNGTFVVCNKQALGFADPNDRTRTCAQRRMRDAKVPSKKISHMRHAHKAQRQGRAYCIVDG